MQIPQSDINNWLTYHAAKIYAEMVNKHVPDSAAKTAAMRKIRESVMAANLAVACNPAKQ